MAITYPISLPTTVADIARITLGNDSRVAVTESPFTFDEQVQVFQGQRWLASVDLPPMERYEAEEWVAFLLALNGREGTFLMGDPSGETARGTASGNPGTPQVDGNGQVGGTLAVKGGPINETGWLLKGDYIQLGSGSTSRLFKVLTDADTNGSGQVTLDVWPKVKRAAPADTDAITVADCKTTWRLSSSRSNWSIQTVIFGVSFGCQEAF